MLSNTAALCTVLGSNLNSKIYLQQNVTRYFRLAPGIVLNVQMKSYGSSDRFSPFINSASSMIALRTLSSRSRRSRCRLLLHCILLLTHLAPSVRDRREVEFLHCGPESCFVYIIKWVSFEWLQRLTLFGRHNCRFAFPTSAQECRILHPRLQLLIPTSQLWAHNQQTTTDQVNVLI